MAAHSRIGMAYHIISLRNALASMACVCAHERVLPRGITALRCILARRFAAPYRSSISTAAPSRALHRTKRAAYARRWRHFRAGTTHSCAAFAAQHRRASF